MTKKRMVVEFGMGTSLRRLDYTSAAVRAVKDALWHNSISLAEAFGFEKSDMIIEAEIGVQQPDKVDTAEIAKIFPYGQVSVDVRHGGLDIPKPNGDGSTLIANAAIVVSFDMEERP